MGEHECQLRVKGDVLLIVLSSRREATTAHGEPEWALGSPLPRFPEDSTFVFWLRCLIEILRLFQLHIVYVLVLLHVCPCLDWGERFLYFLSGLAPVPLNTFMARSTMGAISVKRPSRSFLIRTFFVRALVSSRKSILNLGQSTRST